MTYPFLQFAPQTLFRWSLWARGNSGAWLEVIPRNSPLNRGNFCSNMKWLWDHGKVLPDGTQLSGKTPLYCEMKAMNQNAGGWYAVLASWTGEYTIVRQQLGCW